MHGSGTSDRSARAAAAGRRQRVVHTRRRYNQWAADQTVEDFALRFTPNSARRWSHLRIGNSALGSIAFLVCEAVGASITFEYGFTNAVVALVAMTGVILLTGFPICYYAARYGVDMDLLTRGSGFGYIGSTITSAIYALFTLILFSMEATIMAAALRLCFHMPVVLGYLVSAVVVIPIAAFGVKRISWLQAWTQPIWLTLQIAPLIYIGLHWRAMDGWAGSTPILAGPTGFNPALAASALAVLLSLLPQIGEQVDYLRFLPPLRKGAMIKWWATLSVAGPGWIVIGGAKILIGSALAYLAIHQGFSRAGASDPSQLYNMVFGGLSHSPTIALLLTGVFVAVCQIKINVTNAYAGSIATSNFFSRLTHRHPGRVVWLVFNVLVALQLMETGIVREVSNILALYANFAVAWIGAVTADLLINKPLGLSPKGIEFKRSQLYDLNPVGVGAMVFSLVVSTVLFFGALGQIAQAFSPIAGLIAAFIAAPTIARATRGRYYLARSDDLPTVGAHFLCTVCENSFERPDMAFCPVYQGTICSLCCTLEARCHDACKDSGGIADPATVARRRLVFDNAYAPVARFAGVLLASGVLIGGVLLLIGVRQGGDEATRAATRDVLLLVFGAFMTLSAFAAWFLVLAGENARAAESETDRQTVMLMDEIAAHQQTDAALQKAKEAAESANLAKSRYIVGVSHEIRAPLNAISGYAQLLERNPEENLTDAVRVIRRSSDHLTDLVNGLLDISRIENGTLRLDRARVNLIDLLIQIVDMISLQASSKSLTFHHEWPANLPAYIYADEKRLRQILINLLSNAIKYTETGGASLTVRWRGAVAEFIIADTGIGIASGDLERIFEPFERVGRLGRIDVPGVGLGLTITKVLTTVLGGDIAVHSEPGVGSTFTVKLLLSETPPPAALQALDQTIKGYRGWRRHILVTDDDPVHLDLIKRLLEPVGFDLSFARDGESCLELARQAMPDLAIMDIAMPGMGGWKTAAALRDMAGDRLAILMVSANAHDLSRGRRPDDPHDDFLIKPYEVSDLFDRLATLLDLEWTEAALESPSAS